MQERFVRETNIKELQEEQKRQELLNRINESKNHLRNMYNNMQFAESDLIDYYTYQIKAHQAKLDYLIKIAKRNGIVLNRINELKIRLLRKNNMAV